jgi:hypothetical protein
MPFCTHGVCALEDFPDGLCDHFYQRAAAIRGPSSGHSTTDPAFACGVSGCQNDMRFGGWGAFYDEGCAGFASVSMCECCFKQLYDWEREWFAHMEPQVQIHSTAAQKSP